MLSLERLVIGFQTLVIIFLVMLLLWDQLKKPNVPREPPQPPKKSTPENSN
jgi:hypothetical protein